MSLYDILLNVFVGFSMSGISWLVIHLYSQLIRLYPAPFRDEFGAEMTAVFVEAISEAAAANRHSLILTARTVAQFRAIGAKNHDHY